MNAGLHYRWLSEKQGSNRYIYSWPKDTCLVCSGVAKQGRHLGGRLEGSTDPPRIYDFSFLLYKLYLWLNVKQLKCQPRYRRKNNRPTTHTNYSRTIQYYSLNYILNNIMYDLITIMVFTLLHFVFFLLCYISFLMRHRTCVLAIDFDWLMDFKW